MDNERHIAELKLEIQRLKRENIELQGKLGIVPITEKMLSSKSLPKFSFKFQPLPKVSMDSSTKEKIDLFKMLFRGRDDVYALFWMNEHTGRKGYSPACVDRWTHRKGQPRQYLPLTDQVIHDHLAGTQTIGLFPLLKDNTCWFLACDFDKEGWNLDALSYLDVCRQYGVPAYLERSRSGNGGHVWIFFDSPVSAVSARQLGMRILRLTMDLRADLELGSYDRLFPNQDFLPKGGLGNLIAAPLQKKCRALGNTKFVDPSTTELNSFPDQWNFLSTAKRLSPSQLEILLQAIPPVTVGPGNLVKISYELKTRQPAPQQIQCEISGVISLQRSGIPPWLMAQLKHLASLHNPEFYKREKMRFSTHRIPRFIKCYQEDFSYIHLPRGSLDEIHGIIKLADSELIINDRRNNPEKINLQFKGSLTKEQKEAVQVSLSHNLGILVATPGAGKTVMGCYSISKRQLPTLVLAHRKPILEQWKNQLMTHLDLTPKQIGQVGGGKNKQTWIVDLGMIQSLIRLENLSAVNKIVLIINSLGEIFNNIPSPLFGEAWFKRSYP